MKKSRKTISITLVIIVGVISITTYCIYKNYNISLENKDLETKIITLCQTVYDTYGENTSGKYSDFISDNNYSKLNYRYYYEGTVREKNDAKLSKLKIEGNTATAFYEYIYVAYDKNNKAITSSGNWYEPILQTIILHKENGKWKVVKVYEDP